MTRTYGLGLAVLVSIVACSSSSDDGTDDDGWTEDDWGDVGDDDDVRGDDDDDQEPGPKPGPTPGSPTKPQKALGTVVIRVYRPSGACESDDPSTATAFNGQMHATIYDASGREAYAREPVNPEPRFKFPAYKDYTFKNTSRVVWELAPDKKSGSSFPTSCIAKGEITISSQGETRNVTIWD